MHVIFLFAFLPVLFAQGDAPGLSPLVAAGCKEPKCEECINKAMEKLLNGKSVAEVAKGIDVAKLTINGKSGKPCAGLNAPVGDLMKALVADNYVVGRNLTKEEEAKMTAMCTVFNGC